MSMGIGYSAVQIPTGRLLRCSAQAANQSALFAVQFARPMYLSLTAITSSGRIVPDEGNQTMILHGSGAHDS